MERNINGKLNTNRWLDAVWEPSARIHALPGGLDMLDVSGDGEAKLISADLGIGTTETPRVNYIHINNEIIIIIIFFYLNGKDI